MVFSFQSFLLVIVLSFFEDVSQTGGGVQVAVCRYSVVLYRAQRYPLSMWSWVPVPLLQTSFSSAFSVKKNCLKSSVINCFILFLCTLCSVFLSFFLSVCQSVFFSFFVVVCCFGFVVVVWLCSGSHLI